MMIKQFLKRLIPSKIYIKVLYYFQVPFRKSFVRKNKKIYYPFDNQKADKIFDNILNNKDLPWRKLKQKIKIPFLFFCYNNDHMSYELLLSKFVASWDIKIDSKSFYGTGGGNSNINTYRKIKINDKNFIEKIYLNSDSGLERCLYFYHNILPIIHSSLKSPLIFKKYDGEFISIIYYEYIDLDNKKLSYSKYQFNDVLNKFYSISKRHKLELDSIPSNEIITNYKIQHHTPSEQFDEVDNLLRNKGIDVDKIYISINNSLKVISHNDFNNSNIYQDNFIIDWDTFGMYPLGFEPSYNLFFHLDNIKC